MTMIKKDGHWVTVAGGQRMWVGTKAQLNAALAAGELEDGTAIMVTDDYEEVYHPHPDWANAVVITAAQLYAGYTAPSDGMLVGVAWKDNTTNINMFLKINGVTIAASKYTNSDWAFANVQISVEGGDVLTCTGATALTSHISFVPYKA